MAIGTSYFGSRILRHVAADMEGLRSRGFTGVLHTFSENDFAYYREQMGRIVEASHAVGLEVQLGPWGFGRVFGGEAESSWVGRNIDRCQVMSDGRVVGAACLNDPEFRAHLADWARAAVEAGADRVFWDEPHWAHPRHVGAPEDTWGCRCARCQQLFTDRFGAPMPTELTEEVRAFREDSLVDFVRELVRVVSGLGARSAVCLLPREDPLVGLRDWEPIAATPGLDTLATDPYWRAFGEPVEPFVGRFAAHTAALADRHERLPQIWIQGFGLGPEDADEIHAAVTAARAAGVTDLWTWGFEACGHMPALGTRSPGQVWEALCEALLDATPTAADR
ncbi:hypothetical protein ER308_06465 [Egibacter rhizosphaerae]|uniref:DUF4015 domain-containing protein n=1 Tax=Egibacter rhizosphaerae TaxID=1670831 RepID=A0A411YDI5_9ACTN|nr:hypothetical protein [Egibacter rhizosphaerae]QBI19217.1 hypothetical protein ER308_06465 [Egibacter rhizosphaerae]